MGIDTADQPAKLRNLIPFDHAHKDFFRLSGISSGAVEDRHASVNTPGGDLRDKLIAVLADDIADAGVVDAVQHQVDHLADDEHGDQRIHGALIPPQHKGIGGNDHKVQDEDERSELDMRMALAQEFGHNVYTAGRSADVIDHAKSRTLDHAADDAGKHRIVCCNEASQRKKVDKKSRERDAGKRAEQKIKPKMLPRDKKQRHVHHKCQHTDRQRRKNVDDHRDTDESAGYDRIRKQEKLKPDGIDRRAEDDHEILHDILQRFFLFKTFFDRIHIIHPSAKAAALPCPPASAARRRPAGCAHGSGIYSGLPSP